MSSVIIYHVTGKCNASCPYCHCSNTITGNTYDELSIDEIDKISMNMKKTKLMIITGGEPFLREDIYKILKLFAEKSGISNFVITTNGILSGKIIKTVEKVINDLKINLIISFSFDGPGEHHDEIKGLDKAYENMLKSFYAVKNSGSRRIKAAISVMYTRKNQEYIKWSLKEILEKMNPYSLSITFPRGNIPQESEKEELDMQQYESLCRTVRKYNNLSAVLGLSNLSIFKWFGNIIDAEKRRIIIGLYKREKIRYLKCCAGASVTVITPDGKVMPCELKSDIAGDLRKTDYKILPILNSVDMKRIRKSIYSSKCICTHECFLGPSLLTDCRRWLRFGIKK